MVDALEDNCGMQRGVKIVHSNPGQFRNTEDTKYGSGRDTKGESTRWANENKTNGSTDGSNLIFRAG